MTAPTFTPRPFTLAIVREIEARSGTEFHWIPPCRKQLERPEDYA